MRNALTALAATLAIGASVAIGTTTAQAQPDQVSASRACGAIVSPSGKCYKDGQFCAKRHHGKSTIGYVDRGVKGKIKCRYESRAWRWSDGHAG